MNNMETDNILDLGIRLNKRADGLATEGHEAPALLAMPMYNCAPAVVEIAGTLEESGAYGKVYEAADAEHLRHARTLKRASPRLMHYDMPGLWKGTEKHRDIRFASHHLFSFNLFFMNLPTPRNIDVTNPHLSRLYPGGRCALCNTGPGNEFHILCGCSKLAEVRQFYFEKWFNNLAKYVKLNLNPCMNALSMIMFPANVIDFKFGKVPDAVREALRAQHCDGDKLKKMVKYIRDVTTEMYFKIWSMYGEILGEKNLHFEGKLKTVYDMTINELILKAPAMK